MKRTIIMLAMALIAIFTSVDTAAQSAAETAILDQIVTGLNKDNQEIYANSDGMLTDFKCYRSGRDIYISFRFATNDINFSKFDNEARQMLADTMRDSFLEGVFGSDGNKEVADIFKSIGLKVHFTIYDQFNNKVTSGVDFEKL